MKTGTPKTLSEALKNGINEGNLELHVVDFLSQRFAAEMMKASEDELIVLKRLWENVKKRP